MNTKKRSREVAFALAMATILGTSVAELGSAYQVFAKDLWLEEWV